MTTATTAITRRRFHILTGGSALGLAGGVTLGAAASALLGGCQHNPNLGRDQVIVIPDSVLVAMSSNTWSQIRRRMPVSRDSAANAVLRRVGTRMVDASGQTDVDWEFALLENRVPNAFVLPGGKVAFHTGILPMMANEAQMAAVMGHEIGHVVGRHAAERLSQQLAVQGSLALASYFASGEMSPRMRQVVFAALGAGVSVGFLLPYSRKHEYEADQLGLRSMAAAGYDPRDAGGFWRAMIKANAGRSRPLEFFSTHPADDKRLAAIEEQVPTLLPVYEQKRPA